MGLALIAFLLTVPWVSMAKGIRACFVSRLRALSPQRGSRKSSQRTQTPSSNNDTSKKDTQDSKPLTRALDSFQKAQCWFMLATNIAGLIVEKSGGLDPDSLQQLYNTYVLIKVIAIGGFLPITFTLLNLHMIRKLSWYPIALSIATIAVAIATLKSGNASFTPTTDDFASITSSLTQEPVDACGSQNLVPLCYSPRRDDSFGFNASSSGSSADDILIFCLITLAIILIDHFCRSADDRQQRLNRRILKRLGVDPSKALFPHAGKILRYGTPAFHFIFFWLYIYCFYLYAEDLNWFASNNVYDRAWGFGQIVAVTVWLPTLFDYAWDQFGISPNLSFFCLISLYPPRMAFVVMLAFFFFSRTKDKTWLTFSLFAYAPVDDKDSRERDNKAILRQESGDLEMESSHKLPYHNLSDGGTRDEEDVL